MGMIIRVRIGHVNTHSLYSRPYIKKMEFKLWLAQQMADKKLGQADLARRSRVPQPTIQRILSGETSDPRGSTIGKLERALSGKYEPAQAQPLLDRPDPIISDLAVLRKQQPEEADALLSKIESLEAQIKSVRATIRAAAAKVRRQQEDQGAPESILDPPSARRTALN